MPRQPIGSPGPNVDRQKFEELVAHYRIEEQEEFGAVIADCMSIWVNAWAALHQDKPVYAWDLDETTGRTTRHFVHQGHVIQALLEIEQKLREVVELLRNPQTGAYRPFLETAHRRAGPDEPPPTLGRAGPGSRLIAAVKEAADVARAARDPAVLDGLAADPRRKPGRPKPFGQAWRGHHPATGPVLGDLHEIAGGDAQAGRRQP